jgi:hypothetical protein
LVDGKTRSVGTEVTNGLQPQIPIKDRTEKLHTTDRTVLFGPKEPLTVKLGITLTIRSFQLNAKLAITANFRISGMARTELTRVKLALIATTVTVIAVAIAGIIVIVENAATTLTGKIIVTVATFANCISPGQTHSFIIVGIIATIVAAEKIVAIAIMAIIPVIRTIAKIVSQESIATVVTIATIAIVARLAPIIVTTRRSRQFVIGGMFAAIVTDGVFVTKARIAILVTTGNFHQILSLTTIDTNRH